VPENPSLPRIVDITESAKESTGVIGRGQKRESSTKKKESSKITVKTGIPRPIWHRTILQEWLLRVRGIEEPASVHNDLLTHSSQVFFKQVRERIRQPKHN